MSRPSDWQKKLERTSALAVVPKQPFLDWVKGVAVRHPLKWTSEQLLMAREPIVWIIPAIGTFDSQSHFDSYVNSLKPGLMESEFREICSDQSLWPALTLSTFSEYFDLQIYAHVASSGYLES